MDPFEFTAQKQDELSVRLGDHWKDFARAIDVLTENDIENIDLDNRRSEDKATAMLTRWRRISPTEVKIVDVTEVLRMLQFNDILLDLFNEDNTGVSVPEEGLENTCDPVLNDRHNPIMNEENDLTEFYVRDLKQDHIYHLSGYLDNDDENSGNFVILGEEIFGAFENTQSINVSSDDIPANRFLRANESKNPKMTVAYFIELARDFQHNNIVEYLEKLKLSDSQFRDLKRSQKLEVANMLNEINPAVKCWKSFAERLGFDSTQIRKCDTHIKNKKSSTECLLNKISREKPNFTLNQLKQAASNIGREDVANYLEGVIQDLTSALICQNT